MPRKEFGRHDSLSNLPDLVLKWKSGEKSRINSERCWRLTWHQWVP